MTGSLGNYQKFIFFNKYLGGSGFIYFHDILEFDSLTGQWKQLDWMIEARYDHAVSVIDFDSGLCV